MTWEEIQIQLKSNHLTRIKSVVKNERVIELHVESSPLLVQPASEIIKGIIGDVYSVSWQGNDCDWFVIKKVK